jgi:glycine cleavage system aminomethyltransferase T
MSLGIVMSVQLSLGARVRKSPFFEASVESGLTAASVYNHMYMPTSYGDPDGEYNRLINGVAVWDVAVERQVAVKGPDAIKLAKYLTPRNLDGLVIGQGKYVPICKHDGTIINDPVLLQIADNEVWFSIADSDLYLWVSAIAGSHGMDVEVFEPDVSPLAVQGPKATNVVSNLFGEWVKELKYFGFCEASLDGIPLIVSKSGWSKQGGYELYLRDGTRGYDLWKRVFEAGKDDDIGPGTPNYIERLESGLMSFGADTDAKTNPFELGMDRFVDLDQKNDFVGKDALIHIKRNGIERKFMGFFLDGPRLNKPNEHRLRLIQSGNEVGYVSACGYSPRFGKNIGVGMVFLEALKSSDQIGMQAPETIHSVEVVSLPFEWGGQITSRQAL